MAIILGPTRPDRPAPRFRVVEDRDTGPIPYTLANEHFGTAWATAREAVVDMLAGTTGHWLRRLILPGKSLTATEIRHVRNALADVLVKGNTALAALDEAVDLTRRATRDEDGGA